MLENTHTLKNFKKFLFYLIFNFLKNVYFVFIEVCKKNLLNFQPAVLSTIAVHE